VLVWNGVLQSIIIREVCAFICEIVFVCTRGIVLPASPQTLLKTALGECEEGANVVREQLADCSAQLSASAESVSACEKQNSALVDTATKLQAALDAAVRSSVSLNDTFPGCSV
jgi:hypothetical protein